MSQNLPLQHGTIGGSRGGGQSGHGPLYGFGPLKVAQKVQKIDG